MYGQRPTGNRRSGQPDYFKVDIFDGNADIFIIDAENMEFVMDTLHRQEDSGAMEGHKASPGRQCQAGTPDLRLCQP